MSTTILEHVKVSDLPKKITAQLPEDLSQDAKLLLHIVPESDEQAYFWSKEWQEGEFEAEQDKKKGHISGPFNTVESLKDHILSSGE